MKRLLAGLSGLALMLSGCVAPDDAPPPAPPRPAAGSVGANGRVAADPALWVVKDADTTIYLFGTIHLLRGNVDWFDDDVKRAYDASADVVLEAVAPADPKAAEALFMTIAVDPNGPPLSQKLNAPLRAKYSAAMTRAGLPVAAFEGFEPWFVASQLGLVPLTKLGYTPDNAVEFVLTRAAKASGKPLSGIETFEQQLGFFDQLPEPLQIRFLASTIDELPTVETVFADLSGSWARGDAARLATLMNEGVFETPEIAKVILYDRNARWAQWIDDRLDKPGTSFVAVGAGHLAGANSLQDYLGKRGIKVARVQ